MPFDSTLFDLPQEDKTLTILRLAREGVSDPARWARDHLEDGPRSCALGWVWRHTHGGYLYENTVHVLSRSAPIRPAFSCDCGFCRVSAYNDAPETSHADIVALFDRAIASMEAT